MTRNPRPVVLLPFIFIATTLAVPKYDLIFTSTKCTARQDYISHLSCFINRTDPKTPPRMNLRAQLEKELPDIRVDLAIYFIRENNQTVQLFRTWLKGCAGGLATNSTAAVMREYANILVKYGNFPRECPVPKHYNYTLQNFHVIPEQFPPFTPDMTFVVNITAFFGTEYGGFTLFSDHIEDDCREIHCPQPELDCPADSELKSSATGDSDEDADEDEDGSTNPFDRLADAGLIEQYFPDSMLSRDQRHVIQERSVQHRRREAIKIVPGDYRSFEGVYANYKNHHQPHRKWKRDLIMGVQPHSEDELKKCCPEFQCVCKTCPGAPKCANGKVGILVKEAPGLPGNCCSKYECVAELECSPTKQPNVTYWRDECTKCDCFAGQELCQQLCETKEDDSANNCFSGYLNRPMMNGDTWLEDQDCKECECVNGEIQCEESFCKPVDCANPIKIEGRCCKVCPATSSTSTTTEISTEIPPTDAPVTTPEPSTELSSSTETKTTTSGPLNTTEDNEYNSTSSTAATVIISTQRGIWEQLERKDIIFVLAFVVLLIASASIGAIYVRKTRKQKQSIYSTIPSWESSQSSSVALA